MKKIYFYIVLLFASFSQAQTLIEDFEGTTFPPTGWTYFETGTGVVQPWLQTTLPTFVCEGNKSALITRENVATGLAIDWLVTSPVLVPTNGVLLFTTKTIQVGVQGSNFSVKVSTTSQTDPNSFTTVASWDEASLTTMANYCQEKIIDLSAYSGQNVYIAFVMENDNGDRWIVDNIRMYENLIQPIAFIDLNNNGVKDTNELPFNNGVFQVSVNNGTPTNYVGTNGTFNIFAQSNTDLYDISFNINSEYLGYYSSGVNYNDITSASMGNNSTLNFPITLTNPFSDVEVQLISYGAPVPGHLFGNYIVYKNNGHLIENGTIEFTKPSSFSIYNVIVLENNLNTTYNLNTTGFTVNYSNLQPQESRHVWTTMLVPNIPTVQLGDTATYNATISTTNTDINLNNNSTSITKTIVASYDPNDKDEKHGATIVKDDFTNEDYLMYTIRFQNTGTASTSTVRVEDFLDAKLNPATIRMVDASHDNVLSVQNNHLVWNFNQIFLSPMSVDEASSQGHVTFKVKPFPGYVVGDIIPNTASIYFDTNPAIVTNTFQTEFVAALANESFNLDAITIYPNPSNDYINIQVGENESRMESIEITDLLGKKVYQSKFENRVNISNLSQGVYFITLISNEKEKFTKKIIKE